MRSCTAWSRWGFILCHEAASSQRLSSCYVRVNPLFLAVPYCTLERPVSDRIYKTPETQNLARHLLFLSRKVPIVVRESLYSNW